MIGIAIRRIAFSNRNKYKSREEIVKDVIRQLKGTSTDEIIYFGDGIWDFDTCQKLGINFIGIDINNNGEIPDDDIAIGDIALTEMKRELKK